MFSKYYVINEEDMKNMGTTTPKTKIKNMQLNVFVFIDFFCFMTY